MSEIRAKVDSFLKACGMSHTIVDLQECCANFLSEMELGLVGQKSSLAMLPTYLEASFDLPRKEKVIAMDAGGTNLRVATVYFNEVGQPVIEKFKKTMMPGIKGELGREAFFNDLTAPLKELWGDSHKLGVCFSYPIDMGPDKDGRVIRFSKEIKAPEVEGQLVGDNLKQALVRQGCSGACSTVILNDTAATLLAGAILRTRTAFSSYIGFILGTGTNLCYIEQNSQITKVQVGGAGFQLVNVESGNFNKLNRGEFDLVLDRATINPDTGVFEKMISGRYLGELGRITLQAAAEAGLFSLGASRKLLELVELSTSELSSFLEEPANAKSVLGVIFTGSEEKDGIAAEYLLNNLVERAAKLSAASLAAAVLRSGAGSNPEQPICIMYEGTTFQRVKGLKSLTDHYLQQLLKENGGRYYQFAQVDNASLIGAAVAGLTN